MFGRFVLPAGRRCALISAVSTRDPSLTRPGRVIFAAVLFAASVAAAGAAGWGWIGSTPLPGQGGNAHSVAMAVGQIGAFLLLLATGFAMPNRWRASSVAGPLMLGQAGLLLLAGTVGAAAGRPSGSGSVAAIAGTAALGGALVLTAALLRVRLVSRAAARENMVMTGQHVMGLVTERAQTAMVNNVPRWRVVVRFGDASGTTRWVTKHRTTWDPPQVGQAVDVYFEPSRPDRQRSIVVSW